ncbi:hypothetical protein PR202_gb25858 [Eleusine coracana subsp. coracana]|uniref:TF-B3 domain-containing protein n=1 Tax=Eleusine coracana subsp. coracana TaxID=191504 RepID=A0AAV5FQD7_ELECO|nr:hypothetical protein PR202_gb25858 [Eleusine coracana subsp. coracana]
MGPSGDHTGAPAISRHLKVLLPSSLQKLRISGELARRLMNGDARSGGTAMLVSPLDGKVWRVEVTWDGDGAFLGRGWQDFVAEHGIDALWFLVFRHEIGGVVTIKAFDTSCCLREFSRPRNEMKEKDDAPSSSICKCKSSDDMPSIAEKKKSASSSTLSKKRTAAEAGTNFCTYDIGPPSWIRKRINAYALKHHLPVPSTFCKAIGFSEPCEITLRTSTGNGATRSWQGELFYVYIAPVITL